MMNRYFSLALMLITASMAQYSCRPAAYEIIRQKKSKNVSEQGGPNSIAPEQKDPTDIAPPPVEGNVPPTAGIEVIWNGQSVTKVRVNSPVTIKPTWDTLDPDDIGRSQCTNPGIIRAAYNLDAGATPAAERAGGCETLAVPHVFTRTGEYEISLVVTSNEDETAFASMTIVVIDETAPLESVDGGLKISADPMVAGKGQVITFTAACGLKKKHTVTWNFGDGKTATGAIVKHSYDKEGQFRVEATCTDIDGKSVKAVITIVVINKPVTIPGRPPVNPVDPGVPADPNQPGQPGQQPGQKPGQQPGQKPGQQPGQKPTQG